jgi:hypothetical protein
VNLGLRLPHCILQLVLARALNYFVSIAVDEWRARSHTAVVVAIWPRNGVYFDGVGDGVGIVAEGAINGQDRVAGMAVHSEESP